MGTWESAVAKDNAMVLAMFEGHSISKGKKLIGMIDMLIDIHR